MPKKDDKKPKEPQAKLADSQILNSVDGLGLDEALKIAYGVKSDAQQENESTSADTNQIKITDEGIAKHLEYSPKSHLSGKKAVKVSFEMDDVKKEPTLTPTQQYADIPQKATVTQTNQTQAPKSEQTNRQQIRQQKKQEAINLRQTRKAYKPATRAHGDYDLQGNINATIAKNEGYLRDEQISRKKRRIIALAIVVLFLLFLITFGISMIVSNTTGFTVYMSGNDAGKGLTLYNNSKLQGGTSKLVTTGIPKCDNQTYSEIILPNLETIDFGDGANQDGKKSQERLFFAYSFYVQNAGDGEIDFDFSLHLLETSKRVDEAIRIVLIKDSTNYLDPINKREHRVYAKPISDPKTGKWDYNNPIMQKLYMSNGEIYSDINQDNAVPFYSQAIPIKFQIKSFTKSQLLKYTFIIYIEGGDPDCKDDIIYGAIKLKVELSVTNYTIILK